MSDSWVAVTIEARHRGIRNQGDYPPTEISCQDKTDEKYGDQRCAEDWRMSGELTR
jgi:hypothetical protein